MANPILIGLIFLFALALVAVYVYYRYIKRRYTRERFAFFGVSALSAFMLAALTLLFKNSPATLLIVHVANALFDLKIPTDQFGASFADVVAFCVGSFLLFQIINQLHRNWNGSISTRDHQQQEIGRVPGILQNTKIYIKVIRGDETIEIYQSEPDQKREVFRDFAEDNRLWHRKVMDLLHLIDRQYDINENDWYRDHHCYISSYGGDGERVGIFCCEEPPSDAAVSTFIDFVNTREGQFFKIVIAVNNALGAKYTDQLQGYRIEWRNEAEMLDDLLVMSSYKRRINGYFSKPLEEGGDLSLNDMYVPLGGSVMKMERGAIKRDRGVKNVEAYILNWLRDSDTNPNEHLAVLGQYGQGKTALAHKIVKEILDHQDNYRVIPVLISLQGLSARNESELDLLGRGAQGFSAPAQALQELHRAGKLFIVLDGFDEMDLVGDTELLFNHFIQLWELARVKKAKILITGRPNLFADDEERRMALGIQEPRAYLPYVKAIYLDKLTRPQIETVLRETAPDTRDDILQALDASTEDSSFAELITRPSTLYQLSAVWDQKMAARKDRLNSAEVIGEFLQQDYDRQEKRQRRF